MDPLLDSICKNLEETASSISKYGTPKKTLKETVNWQFPALSREDLAGMAIELANKLRAADISGLASYDLDKYADLPQRIQTLWPDVIPQMFNGQPGAVYAYTESIHALERILSPLISMVDSGDVRYVPPKIITRIKNANRRIDKIEADEEGLARRVDEINKAYSVAEKMPGTLEELEQARADLEEIRARMERIYEDATKAAGKVESNLSTSEKNLGDMHVQADIAAKLVKQCEDAYQITTTKGLAGAFAQRAWWLNLSIILWVIGLLGALYFGAEFGARRIDALSALTSKGTPEWGIILMHVVLSILSVGGPLWFAWLATKQIGQRFRLAEDYAFKASVAKAYEGYRKQAANLDEEFSSRLFSSALNRLDEAPLRLVEQHAHGSPWHEASQAEVIKTAIAIVPGFAGDAANLAKKALEAFSSRRSSKTADPSAASPPKVTDPE